MSYSAFKTQGSVWEAETGNCSDSVVNLTRLGVAAAYSSWICFIYTFELLIEFFIALAFDIIIMVTSLIGLQRFNKSSTFVDALRVQGVFFGIVVTAVQLGVVVSENVFS